MKYYLAIDIGASSGRHIIGWKDNEEIHTEEVYRFNNGIIEEDGHLIWDVAYLLREVKKGIKEAKKRYRIESLSIDTWGVDYVLLKEEKEVLPVYAYRDKRTGRVIDEVHSIIPFEQLYQRTGCQFQPFNTIYQLYADKKQGRLQDVTDFLMIPEYLLYKLTGVKKKEFTNATTTGLVNCESLQFDKFIVERLDLPAALFGRLSQPQEELGYYEGIRVVLCATHDTASAVEGIPMKDHELYISSGTWSLLGVKTEKPLTDINSMKANYSNEGGAGYN
ncbi:MAG TPA: FGGY family carbohydrate kinase, partial [Erysipelotrichaceae bacterium]|nr:FGGY family carbohydrate kinase [Erysipelotrichaceae bacterium]